MVREVQRAPISVQQEFKTKLYDFFERQLDEGNIRLGRESGRFDMGRRKIDTVIIHHTSNPPGLSPSRLSAIELIRLYAPHFANATAAEDNYLKGQAIFSGHVRNGKQVFWPYHWIIRNDGRAERLLRDSEIGWHAGDWDVNCRSIAIVLDNDYEHGRPGDRKLGAIARIIATHYTNVPLRRILGHPPAAGMIRDCWHRTRFPLKAYSVPRRSVSHVSFRAIVLAFRSRAFFCPKLVSSFASRP